MEETIRSVVLGIVQGLTEFLPVSSSGHLELAKFFLGDDSAASQSLMMTVALHAATALSTLVIFRREVTQIFRGLLQFKANEEFFFSVKIVLSMIPAVLVGLLFETQIELLFNKQILLVSAMLVITGLLLYLADRAKRTDKTVGYNDSIIIGIAQAIAILPGISRSGATISTSVLLGVDREKAARFSFLMVVPLIMGKIAKDLLDGSFSQSSEQLASIAVGFVAAFITGALACLWMIRLVKNSRLRYFSIYCFLVATVAALAYYYQ